MLSVSVLFVPDTDLDFILTMLVALAGLSIPEKADPVASAAKSPPAPGETTARPLSCREGHRKDFLLTAREWSSPLLAAPEGDPGCEPPSATLAVMSGTSFG